MRGWLRPLRALPGAGQQEQRRAGAHARKRKRRNGGSVLRGSAAGMRVGAGRAERPADGSSRLPCSRAAASSGVGNYSGPAARGAAPHRGTPGRRRASSAMGCGSVCSTTCARALSNGTDNAPGRRSGADRRNACRQKSGSGPAGRAGCPRWWRKWRKTSFRRDSCPGRRQR